MSRPSRRVLNRPLPTAEAGTDNGPDGIDWTTGGYVGGTGVSSVSAAGDPELVGDVTLSAGANVTLTQVGQDIEIASTGGGGGGGPIAYGALKPGTPTRDFTGSDLAGATAVNNTGSFGVGNCFEGALDGSHLSLGYQGQSGFLYWGVSNTDMVVSCGGLHSTLGDTQSYMQGIAVLNTSNTGVGLVVYNDGNAYLASITAGVYAGILQTISGYGHGASSVQGTSATRYALRLNRTGNNWTGQLSVDGMNWLSATASSSVTITAARVAAGLLYDGAAAYKGRVFLDWLNVA